MTPQADRLYRVVKPGLEYRAAGDQQPETLCGHFAVFNEWAEINSVREGHFLERFAPGAFAKTLTEDLAGVPVLFQHGRDPQIGKKPLGPIKAAVETDAGVYYEVPLLDTAYNAELRPALASGLYGSSFAFEIVSQEYDRSPGISEHNPHGLPEKTVTEARVFEFGPAIFPSYKGATAGLRSLTDEWADEEQERDGLPASIATRDRERSEERRYERIVQYVSETPWAIHPAGLETIQLIIAERMEGYRPSAEEISERIGARRPRVSAADGSDGSGGPKGPIAVIPLQGTIMPRADAFMDISGGVAIESVQSAFRAALESSDVKAIVLNLDTPGGSVDLVPELAAEIFAARGVKQIVAIANTWAASAGYFIASAASELVATPSGEVGSIGVWSAHQDMSAAYAKLGVKYTLVKAGKYKVEGNPFGPLSKEAEAYMQKKVDAYYGQFVDAVALGRGVDVEDVLTGFGEGRMVMAAEALQMGMVDRVETLQDLLTRLGLEHAPEAAEPEQVDAPALQSRLSRQRLAEHSLAH